MKPILITGYVNPDLDAVAGTIAYSEFLNKTGKNTTVGLIGEPHEEARYILDRYTIKYPEIIENADNFNEVILVDASDLIGIEGKIAPEKVIEIIDHRKIHEADKFPNAKVQIELVGSASTLVAERFIKNNIEISKELFKSKSDLSGNKLKERIVGDLAWFNNMGNKKSSIAQLEIIGAEKLITERLDEIIKILEDTKKEMQLNLIFMNMIDLGEYKSYFISDDIATQKILEKILDIKFDGFVAEKSNLIMRKQIVPLLKEELEN